MNRIALLALLALVALAPSVSVAQQESVKDFATYDTDNNASLSPDEYQAAVDAKAATEDFATVDQNGDGMIEEQEFMAEENGGMTGREMGEHHHEMMGKGQMSGETAPGMGKQMGEHMQEHTSGGQVGEASREANSQKGQ